MVRAALSTVFAIAALATSAAAVKCSATSKCPAETPCCSLYGECGVGAFCLGGCDPLMSNSFDSCVPNPVCKSGTYTLDSLNNVQTIDKYLGDASKIDWQSQGVPAVYKDPSTGKSSTLLTMAKGTVGTLLASTHYVWYGKICSRLTTAQGKGVVTAFILMSDVKDEIDFEWVGVDTAHVQSNFYSQGVTNYKNGENLTISGSNSLNEHQYCLDWKQDTLEWSIDGNKMRTLNRKDTWNSTSGRFDYPQTPARIMLSLWPAGLPSNEKGTIDWAGGEIDWNSQYMANGYYFARFSEVTVECYDAPPAAKKQGSKSYQYTDARGTNDTVAITNKQVVLGSLLGTGEKPGDAPKKDDPKPSSNAATVPGGISGGGSRADSESAAPAQASPAPGTPAIDGTQIGGNNVGWSQGPVGGSSSSSTGAGAIVGPVSGSALAIVVAIIALCVL